MNSLSTKSRQDQEILITATTTEPSRVGSGPRQSPAVAAQAVMPIINGPLLVGEVLSSWRSALAVAVDAPEGTRVLGLLTAEASGVPHGVRLNVSADSHPFRQYSGGDPVFVGAGSIQLHGWQIRPTRVFGTAIALTQPDVTCLAYFDELMKGVAIGVPHHALADLRAALAERDAAALRIAVSGLVGLGAGLTPGGDDILAGLLAGLHAVGRPALIQQVTVAMSPRLSERTTIFSADLLRMAAAGHASVESLALLRALDRRTGDREAVRSAFAKLAAVGHTSGADMATGMLLGLTQPTSYAPTRPRVASRSTRKSG